MHGDEILVALVSLATLIGGVVVIIAGLHHRTRMRELRHQERLALIEKGLLPPPEFEPASVASAPMQRSRSLGIIVVGLGFALMFLIGIAGGALDSGIGIGGAVVILGAAFIVRSIYGIPPPRMPRSEPPAPPPDSLRP
jgi:small-conductance mechanosensitive channel